MNKKALYESIMKDVAKIVKKRLNENTEAPSKNFNLSNPDSLDTEEINDKFTLFDILKTTKKIRKIGDLMNQMNVNSYSIYAEYDCFRYTIWDGEQADLSNISLHRDNLGDADVEIIDESFIRPKLVLQLYFGDETSYRTDFNYALDKVRELANHKMYTCDEVISSRKSEEYFSGEGCIEFHIQLYKDIEYLLHDIKMICAAYKKYSFK